MSHVRSRVWRSTYQDSVALMRISKAVGAMVGVLRAAVMMGTPQNRFYLREAGLYAEDLEMAAPDDLIAVVAADSSAAAEQALAKVDEFLAAKAAASRLQGPMRRPTTYRQALEVLPNANLALISTPGAYAAAEALHALKRGLNVMIFSDHVTVEEEVELKRYASAHGLLVMGPDCGTAIISGRPLAFANAVRQGSVGIIGASGTGIQQVSVLIDRLGAGVSYAIGVGSRDLSREVGAISMLHSIDLLEQDPHTRVLVLISKPPHPDVAAQVLRRVERVQMPVVVNFLGMDPDTLGLEGTAVPAATLESAAVLAAGLALGRSVEVPALEPADAAVLDGWQPAPSQRYIRGMYAGGTLAYEAMHILGPTLGPIFSNIPLQEDWRVGADLAARGHTCIDYGDDQFTAGRPHPMLDSTMRAERMMREARDPETAVLLVDVMLGYGAQPDPAGVLAEAIAAARAEAAAAGRDLAVLAAVCGTAADPQGLAQQAATLRAAGAAVCPSNAAAARAAMALLSRQQTSQAPGGRFHG